MKTKKAKPQAAATPPKGKTKIKDLKLNKETIERGPDADAIKGGMHTVRNCY